ncbi:hypothetical protein ACWCHM_05490 [Micromonospora sp. SCSIO 07396]
MDDQPDPHHPERHPTRPKHDNRHPHDDKHHRDNQHRHDTKHPHDNRRPYHERRSDEDSPPESGGDLGLLVSDQDVEDADDILFAHPPHVVTRKVCGCGDDYPCEQVRYARLIKAARGPR